jgi:hypothetical protein
MFEEAVVPSPSKIFKICKTGSVLQNEGKHIKKALFLSKIIRLVPTKVMQYINTIL